MNLQGWLVTRAYSNAADVNLLTEMGKAGSEGNYLLLRSSVQGECRAKPQMQNTT